MGHHHQAMGAAAGSGFIVVLGDELRDRVGELGAECGAIGRRAEADLGVDGEGGESQSARCRPSDEVTHLANDASAECDEVGGRQSIDFSFGIHGDRPHRAR